jgi:hypothetical protein
MNLVNELQVSTEQDDVLTVLRKAKRLASKLGVDDINNWLRCEQEGYAEDQAIPKYRTAVGTLVFKTNGPIPVGMGMVGQGVMDYPGNFTVDRQLPDSMSEIVSMIHQCEERNHGLYLSLDDSDVLRQLRNRMHPIVSNNVTFLLQLNTGQVRAIPEAVKDRVLEWACELERRGVHGEGMTFNDKEKQIAHTIVFNIKDSTVGQLNNMGRNILGGGES